MINFDKNFDSHKDFRDYFQDSIRKELHGPYKTDDETFRNHILNRPPKEIYSMGMLFPQEELNENQIDDGGTIDSQNDENNLLTDNENIEDKDFIKKPFNNKTDLSIDGDSYNDDINLANQYFPSSFGISFNCDNNSIINGELYFAKYSILKNEKDLPYDQYKRVEYTNRFKINVQNKSIEDLENPSDQWKLKVRIRRKKFFSVVTIWLVNNLYKHTKGNLSEKIIFQPQIILETQNSFFLPIENFENINLDDDTKSNFLLYRDKKAYARGHGCSGDWKLDQEGKCYKIYTNLFPDYEIKPIIPSLESVSDRNVDLSFLGNSLFNETDDVAKEKIIKNLKLFIEDYNDWISQKEIDIQNLDVKFIEIAQEHISKCKEASQRMTTGVNYLNEDNNALLAFRLANYSMLIQQIRGSLKSRSVNEEDFPNPDLNNKERKWFPFQLAFLLLNIDGIPLGEKFNKENSGLVDLIWFPTGGGKTEAYLGVAAYAISLSRLLYQDKIGTEVIMRYTLRLLTVQQFERASCLILALEYLRRKGFFKNEQISNSTKKFTAGLWVGPLTPNRTAAASNKLRKMRKEEGTPNSFAILECPWCKTSLEENNYQGYKGNTNKFHFVCGDKKCDFYDEIPLNVVDDELYKNPPTLLLGTVDKFAQITWRDEPAVFFGKIGKSPSLIIQDELHLISGPLGSIVGHYEVLINLIIKEFGPSPKIIASTATIRRAKEQVFGLYRSNFRVFPPQGIDYDDSFFAKEAKDPEKNPGRRYVGIFSSGLPSHLTAQVRLLSPLIQFPSTFFKKHLTKKTHENIEGYDVISEDVFDEYIEPYGTIVWYFNSLKEMGYADNLINEDIAQYIKVICKNHDIPYPLRKQVINNKEMTSRAKENEIADLLKQLKVEWRPYRYHSSIDVLSATSMISVGVDIDRLGLMVITGQPKNTSEYIQASSRVGRKKPGLVFTLYNHGRSRDRSHFESFKSYHQAIYKYVEPTSITPFSYKSRERSIAGLIIGIARICLDLKNPKDIIEKEIEIKKKLENYFDVLKMFELIGDDYEVAQYQVENIFNQWKIFIKKNEGNVITWVDKNQNNLLTEYGRNDSEDNLKRIEMLTSMRDVDVESTFEITTLLAKE